jgi:hypothetical protein
MKVRFLGFVVAIFALALSTGVRADDHGGGFEQDNRSGGESAAAKCARRVREAGCLLSNNDMERIKENVVECKQVTSAKGTTRLEIFRLDKSDKLVVFQTKGVGVPNHAGQCPLTKYTVDRSGIKDILVRGNKTYMISNDGQLYVMMPDQSVQEIYNGSGKPYGGGGGITKIGGVNGDEGALHIEGKTFDSVLSEDTLNGRKKVALQFVKTFTFESLFRDK